MASEILLGSMFLERHWLGSTTINNVTQLQSFDLNYPNGSKFVKKNREKKQAKHKKVLKTMTFVLYIFTSNRRYNVKLPNNHLLYTCLSCFIIFDVHVATVGASSLATQAWLT